MNKYKTGFKKLFSPSFANLVHYELTKTTFCATESRLIEAQPLLPFTNIIKTT